MRLNLKMTVTMVVFSIGVTLVILASFLFLRNRFTSVDMETFFGGEAVYVVESAGNVPLDGTTELTFNSSEQVISSDRVTQFYQDEFFKYLPSIALIISVIILVLIILLWAILQKLYSKQVLELAQELTLIEQQSNETVKDEVLEMALASLRTKFDNQLNDYKRLNSYLTHEQKNTIAILRAKLELQAGNQENLLLLDRLTDSIDDILTLSNHTDELGDEIVDVSLICAQVCDAYRPNYPALTFHFDEEATTLIRGRDRWIYRAVSNLVDNAIKYGAGQPITVTVGAQKGSVLVTVKDAGVGVPLEKQTEIFSHKYRIHGLKQDGYGIGLSVVNHVCELCRGFVYLESELKQGATFYLTFPSCC